MLFAEALICISPRGLWDLDTGEPSAGHIVEARIIIELALARLEGRDNTTLCYLYIHLMEMSPFPEKALPPANRLCRLAPDASVMIRLAYVINT